MNETRPTDTLANERTFLAYARTALAFIAFGFVIARFALFTREVATVLHTSVEPSVTSTRFGIVLALAGVVCAVYGAYRYVVTARALRAGRNAPMPDSAAIVLTAAIGLLGLVVAVVLFVAYR